MISRYTRPEMGDIWTEQNKLQKWLDVELAALEAVLASSVSLSLMAAPFGTRQT